jgi:MFS family permease
VLFFVNGAASANWVPRIPDVKQVLELTAGALGLALLGMGLGALFGSLAAGVLVTRFGSRSVATGAAVSLGLVLVGPGLATSWATLALALVLLGVADGAIDVAMNAHAVAVQRRYQRSIVNTFHALWSLGAMTGSLCGALAAARNVPTARHLAAAGLVLGAVVIATHRCLLPTAAVRLPAGEDAADTPIQRRINRARRRGLVAPTGIVGVLGLMTLLAALVEDAPGSWSAVYMRESLAASPGVAGLGFAA